MLSSIRRALHVTSVQPCERSTKLVTLRRSDLQGQRDAIAKISRYGPFQPTKFVEVCDDPFAEHPLLQGKKGDAARRKINSPARIFVPIAEHIPTPKAQFDTLVASALDEFYSK